MYFDKDVERKCTQDISCHVIYWACWIYALFLVINYIVLNAHAILMLFESPLIGVHTHMVQSYTMLIFSFKCQHNSFMFVCLGKEVACIVQLICWYIMSVKVSTCSYWTNFYTEC